MNLYSVTFGNENVNDEKTKRRVFPSCLNASPIRLKTTSWESDGNQPMNAQNNKKKKEQGNSLCEYPVVSYRVA